MMGDWHGEVDGDLPGDPVKRPSVPSAPPASSPSSPRLPMVMRLSALFDQMAASARDVVLASSVEEIDDLTKIIQSMVLEFVKKKNRVRCEVCGLAFVGLRSILETGGVAGVVEKVDADDVAEVVRLRKMVRKMGERIACQSEALARAAERNGVERKS